MLRTSLLIGSVLLCPSLVFGQMTFTKIVETGDPRPSSLGGTNGVFEDLRAPGLDGGVIGFEDGSGPRIYTNLGGAIQVVVDENTLIPGGGGAMFTLTDDDVPVSDGNLVFQHFDGPNQGYYSFSGGVLSRAATDSDPAPSGDGNLITGNSDPFRLVGQDFAFEARDASVRGIHTLIGGVLATVADENTTVPGTMGTFENFDEPNRDTNGDIVFEGSAGGFNGIHGRINGVLTTIIDATTPVPDGVGTFAFAGDPYIENGDIVFIGEDGSGDHGIYRSLGGGPFEAFAVEGVTPVPGGVGTFSLLDFDSLSIADGAIAFLGEDANGDSALFIELDGVLTRVIGAGEVLDGKTLDAVDMVKQGRDGTDLAFLASFTDQTSALYIVQTRMTSALEVPGLSGLGIVLFVSLILLVARGRLAV